MSVLPSRAAVIELHTIRSDDRQVGTAALVLDLIFNIDAIVLASV